MCLNDYRLVRVYKLNKNAEKCRKKIAYKGHFTLLCTLNGSFLFLSTCKYLNGKLKPNLPLS